MSSFEQRLMREIEYREGKVRLHSETETEYDSEQPEEKVSSTQTQAPQVQQPLKDFRLIEGSDATFVCKVSGRPRPKVSGFSVMKKNIKTKKPKQNNREAHCTISLSSEKE